MRHEAIVKIIDQVNGKRGSAKIFKRPLLDDIWVARVWQPDPTEPRLWDCDMFLVFSEGICVGAIEDLVVDLHAATLESHRRRGLMKSAFRNAILPFLRSKGRTVQEVTIHSEEGRALARSIGFVETSEDKATLDLRSIPERDFPESAPTGFDEGELDSLNKRIRTLAAELLMIRDQASFSLGDWPVDHFSQEASRARDLTADLSDHWRFAMHRITRQHRGLSL